MIRIGMGLLFVTLLTIGTAHADSVSPAFDSFGTLSGATFGGSGIPNDAVAITTITDGAVTIILGLTATQRYANPSVTNDGAGTFYAGAGDDGGNALWNFDYYIDIAGSDFTSYQFNLLYDFDPGTGTDTSELGNLDFNTAIVALGGSLTATNVQDSQNLAFSFLGTDSVAIDAPSYGAFDPDALGQYSFLLQATRISDGTRLGQAAINVNVIPVPESSTNAMLGIGLACVAFAQWRKTIV